MPDDSNKPKYRAVFFTLSQATPEAEASGGESEAIKIELKPEGEWTLTAGLTPDVNRAIVPYVSFDKLLDEKGVIRKRGDITWFWDDETTPIYTLKDWQIVDVEAEESGTIVESDQTTVTLTDRVVSYRLQFADPRVRIQFPRGGRLYKGLLNPDPSRKPDSPDLVDPQRYTNADLIGFCLERMGFEAAVTPDTVVDYFPPQNVEWYGSHATAELDKLLKACQHVFCPNDDPSKLIQKIGVGSEPIIPLVGRESPHLEVDGIDRRGKTIIIDSSPTAIVDTWTYRPNTDPLLFPGWTFCVRKEPKKEEWIDIADFVALGDPLAFLHDQYQRKYGEQTDATRAFRQDAWHYLQLDPQKYPPQHCPLRQFVLRDPKLTDDGVRCTQERTRLLLKGAHHTSTYGYAPSVDFEEVITDFVQGNRLHTIQRVGKLPPGYTYVDTLDDVFIPGDFGTDFWINFSVEAWDNERAEKKYFRCGFRKDLDQVVQLADEEVLAIIDGKTGDDDDAVILPMPELLLVIENGLDDPDDPESLRGKLIARAKARATEILNAGSTVGQRTAAGFVYAELSGKLSRITLDYDDCTTQFDLNDWAMPLGAATYSNVPSPTNDRGASASTATSSAPQFANASAAPKPTIALQPPPQPIVVMPPVGTYQYSVHMMVADNVAGWDYPRAHEP